MASKNDLTQREKEAIGMFVSMVIGNMGYDEFVEGYIHDGSMIGLDKSEMDELQSAIAKLK